MSWEPCRKPSSPATLQQNATAWWFEATGTDGTVGRAIPQPHTPLAVLEAMLQRRQSDGQSPDISLLLSCQTYVAQVGLQFTM